MQAPGQVQRGSTEGSEGSEEGLGGFGAEPGQVQQGSGEGSRKPWCKAKSGSTGSVEGSGQGLGGFGAEKVPEKVPGSLGAKPSQVQHGSGEGSGEGRGGFGAEPAQVRE